MGASKQLLRVRWGLAIIIALVITLPSAFAWISNENPAPGETVSFEISGWILGEPNYFIKEPSGIYNEKPDYLNISFVYVSSSMLAYYVPCHWHRVIGTITIPENAASGYYQLVIDSQSYPQESQFSQNFYVTGIPKNWKYSNNAPAGWQNPGFNDSAWKSGEAPFGGAFLGFELKSSWEQDQPNLYTRKTFNLSADNTQGNLRVTGEGNLECYVNGNQVISKSSLKYPGGHTFNSDFRGSFNGKTYDSANNIYAYYDSVPNIYEGEYVLDVSKYLKAGENTIACRAGIETNVYTASGVNLNSRPYFDAEFRPLQKSDFYWGKYSSDLKNSNVNLSSDINTYRWFRVGNVNPIQSYYYTKNNEGYSGNLYMSSGPVQNGNWFYWTADYYNSWDYAVEGTSGGRLNARVFIQPLRPFSGSDTWIRKWVWSDSNVTQILQISDTKMPDCYVNGNLISLSAINGSYWRYSSSVEMKAGQNLIACYSRNIAFNYFDMQIAEPNKLLGIIDVSANTSQFKANEPVEFTVAFENASHPQIDVALMLEAWGNTDYQELLTTADSSTATITFTPAEDGDYELLFTAQDLIDNDSATYSTNITVATSGPLPNIGFFPTAGTSDESSKGAGGTALVGLAAAAVGAIALGGAYLVSGKSSGFPLSKVEGSLSRASNAMNTLNTLSGVKATANENSFWSMITSKYNQAQNYLAQKAQELADTMRMKQKFEESQEAQAKARSLRHAAIKAQEAIAAAKLSASQPMTWAQWYAQQGIEMPENRKNPVTVKPVAWNEMEAQVQAEKTKNSNERLPYNELYNQKTAWEKVTGTIWGAIKFGAVDQNRKTNTIKNIFGELINGNILGAIHTGTQYLKDEISTVFNGVKNNLQIITGAAVAGAGVAFIAGTVGIGTPVGVALIAAGGAMMFNNIRDRYAEPLNEINDFYDIDFNTMETRFLDNDYTMQGYWKVKENLVGDAAAIAAGMGSYYGTAGYVNPLIWKYNYGVDTPKLAFNQKVTLTNKWADWREGLLRLNEFSNVNKISIVPGGYIDYWGRHFYNGNVRLNFNAFSECPGAVTVVSTHEAIENAIYRKHGSAYFNTGVFYDYGKQETIVESINRAYLGETEFTKGFSESVRAETKDVINSIHSGELTYVDNMDWVKTQAKNLAVLKNTDSALYNELKTAFLKLSNGEQIVSMSEYYNNIFNQDWSFLISE